MRLSVTQRALLEALAETGRPGHTVSATELEGRTGVKRATMRTALRDLRDKLGVDQAADLVRVARARGLLPAADGEAHKPPCAASAPP